MKVPFFAIGAVAGLSIGLIGAGVLWRELHQTRLRLAYYEEKEARMKAHLQSRQAVDDDHQLRRSSRRLSDDQA